MNEDYFQIQRIRMPNTFFQPETTANTAVLMQLMQAANSKSIAASQVYIPQGGLFKKIVFIKKGIMRSYYVTDLGEEKTMFFRWEGQFAAVPECIFNNQPTQQSWQALEDCDLMEIDFENLEKLSEGNMHLLKTRMQFSQRLLLEALSRVESFVMDKPEERYLKLIAQKPEIIKRVPDKYIASFIGITPVSLSRIRKRLASPKK